MKSTYQWFAWRGYRPAMSSQPSVFYDVIIKLWHHDDVIRYRITSNRGWIFQKVISLTTKDIFTIFVSSYRPRIMWHVLHRYDPNMTQWVTIIVTSYRFQKYVWGKVQPMSVLPADPMADVFFGTSADVRSDPMFSVDINNALKNANLCWHTKDKPVIREGGAITSQRKLKHSTCCYGRLLLIQTPINHNLTYFFSKDWRLI